MRAEGIRFTVAGAFGGAVQAVRRAPGPLGLLLVANILVTAFLAWLEAGVLSGAGLAPWLGRTVVEFGFVVVDATLGMMALVVAIDALGGLPVNLRDAGRRVRSALAVSLPLTLLSTGVRMLAGMFLYAPISGPGDGYFFYPLVRLAETASAILIACTIGMAAFAAVTGTRPMAAWGRSLRLVRRARWRLVVITLILAVSGEIASELGSTAANLIVPGETPDPLWNAVSQSVYTTWYMATVLLTAGIGTMLARVEATRDPDELADTFA